MHTGPSTLRPHQVEAADAAVRALEPKPGKSFPPNGLRATVVSACGTGKTITAAHAAMRIAPYGRVLVLVPTLDLLSQTVAAWQAEGRDGMAVAVCSLSDDPVLWNAGVRVTTNPIQLALWLAGKSHVTVFGTYSSLPVLIEAHEGAYGQQLDRWDLVVVDEAHRTSGSMGKAWADVHDQALLPADRRLYLTATPRIWEARPAVEVREGVREALPEEMAASMDDPAVFGPTVYELPLAEAVRLELLAQFQIVVAELRDPELADGQLRGEEKRTEEVRGKRIAALQTAVLEAAAEHNLKTMITFHHRTMEAEAWAAGLPGVAAKLHALDPGRYPARRLVWADWLHGEHEAEHRREVLRQFGDRVDRHGRPVRQAVLSNCRVLGEGVDVPAVDSVAIIDPKGSVVDIVQAIGRALRQKPRQGKMATIMVPVFLEHGESPEEMYASGSYRPLVNVMQALRAHDSKMVEMLAVPQDHTSPVGPSESIGTAPAEGEEEGRLLLRFSARRSPEAIRRFVDMQVINPVRESWARGFAAAARYVGGHGNLRVPLTYREPGSGYPLGRWISDQRTEYAAGRLDYDAEGRERKRRLNEIGMVWSAPDLAWEENLAAARTYFAEHGTLCAPQGAAAAGKPVGQWLTNLRRPGGLGKDPIKAAQRRADLVEVDPEWNPRELGWTTGWQRNYVKVKTCLDGGASLEELAPGVRVGGEDVGRWLKRQQEAWEALNAEQQRRLQALGVAAAVRPPEARTAAVRGGARAAGFERGLAAARQYREREGTLEGVSRKHMEVVVDPATQAEASVRLGVWLSNVRSRRDSLTPERAEALNELGLRWT
ncbi:Helicase associated domain protein [Streptomyces sp. WMMC500]|uniref:DEAD/DEAH box helicase n=1 Tax=Streptomyces sp. WMMC500 TaxID=3015154 RepID=UPI00248AE840|nr:DEAD/DEAH box helicase [Streptomyces sp. WMMC500]WBB60988.1 Helicase associated domain protein [Streptomyces sp. WMMC500]